MIPAIKILPEDLQQITSSAYQLLVLLGRNDWQFALLNREKKMLEGLLAFHADKAITDADFGNKWNAVQEDYPLLGKYYSSVTVVIATTEVALLPVNELGENNLATILNTLHGEKEETIVKSDFTSNDLQVVYRIPASANKLIERTYINASIKHYYTAELFSLNMDGVENGLYVNFFSRQFSVMVIKNKQLQLLNQYDYRQPEDVLFYLLTIAKEFEYNREEAPLLISGMLDENSALFADLKKYFISIQFTSVPAAISCSEGFEEYPQQYFHSLFSAAL